MRKRVRTPLYPGEHPFGNNSAGAGSGQELAATRALAIAPFTAGLEMGVETGIDRDDDADRRGHRAAVYSDRTPSGLVSQEVENRSMQRRTFLSAATGGLLAAPLAAPAQHAGQVLPWDPAPRKVLLELQQALAHAIERFQAMDEAGVLSHVSDHYRTDPLTKAGIREQLRAMFALYDTLRAQVRIDEARTAGERALVYSTGEISGRLRWLATWTPILSWQREPELAQREQGIWRLYGYQQ